MCLLALVLLNHSAREGRGPQRCLPRKGGRVLTSEGPWRERTAMNSGDAIGPQECHSGVGGHTLSPGARGPLGVFDGPVGTAPLSAEPMAASLLLWRAPCGDLMIGTLPCWTVSSSEVESRCPPSLYPQCLALCLAQSEYLRDVC